MLTRDPARSLQPFLGGSVAVHLLLALALGLLLAPALVPASIETPTARPEEPAVVPPEPEPEAMTPVVEMAKEEIRKVAASEVARDQLRPTFERLMAGVMPPSDIQEFWEGLIPDIDGELFELVDLLEQPGFDLPQFEARVKKAREAMLNKVDEKLRVAEAREMSAPLAQAVREQIGKPLGEALAQALEKQHQESLARLREAARDLATTQKPRETIAQKLEERHPDLAKAVRDGAHSRDHLAEATRLQAAREQVAAAARQAKQAARTNRPDEASKVAEKAQATAHAATADLAAVRPEMVAPVREAEQKLEHGKSDLAARKVPQAREHLKDAQAKLEAVEAKLKAEQEKLGIKPVDHANATLAQVEEDLAGPLARKIDEKIQSQLERKLDPRVAAELKKENPGKHAAEAARDHLPDAVDSPKTDAAHAAAQKSEAEALAALDARVTAAVNQAMKHNVPGGSEAHAELLRRIERQHGPESANHLADGAAAAGLRARVQQARESVGGMRHAWDPAAYRRMMEHLKDREKVVGDLVARQSADGPVGKAGAEAELRPAFVGISSGATVPASETKPNRRVPEPTFRTHRFSGIPLLSDDVITLDGDLTDWKDVPTLDLVPVIKGAGKTIKFKPDRQIARAAWCPSGLLLAFDVEDTSGAIENAGPIQAFWMLDCVEIYIDTLNTKSNQRGEPHTHQFFVLPFGHKDHPERGGYESFVQGDGLRIVPHETTIRRAARRTARGWTLEVLLTREVLRLAELEPGRVVGFNLQVDSGTDLYYYWTAAEKFMTSMHPNTWGDLQLLGSDARIAFVGEDGKTPVEAVVPGKPLRVRLNDPDMNTSPSKKERVGLTLRTSSGQTRTLVLEETTPTSGVFAASIGTTLDIGGTGPALVLPVLEGEMVLAEYVDQVAAFGERNRKVTTRVPVASLGTRP